MINYIRYSLYTLYARICFIQASPWDRHGNTATYLSNTVGPTVEMNLYGVSSFEKNHVAPSCIDPHQRDSSLICGQCLLSSATFLRQNTPYFISHFLLATHILFNDELMIFTRWIQRTEYPSVAIAPGRRCWKGHWWPASPAMGGMSKASIRPASPCFTWKWWKMAPTQGGCF